MCFDFLYNFVRNISHSKNNSARYHKCTYIFMWSTCYSCQTATKPEFCWQIFKQYSNIKFHENPSSGTLSCFAWMVRQRDKHEEANGHVSQLCKHALKKKKKQKGKKVYLYLSTPWRNTRGGRASFIFTSALYGGEWPTSNSGCFSPGEKNPRTHWIGG